MRNSLASVIASLAIGISLSGYVQSQSSTGTIFGTVVDPNQAVMRGATVTARNIETGFSRTTTTDSNGIYRLVGIPTGIYEIVVAAPGFSTFKQIGVTLAASQDVDAGAKLIVATLPNETVEVTENASMLDSTTAEVSTHFDSRRLSELPTSPNRHLFTVLYSVPGVIRPVSGQAKGAVGESFSSNGARLRSNNFMLDGQDINDPALTGAQMPLNNPDAFQEVRIVTNQFLPEYGRTAGSVVNLVGKSGTNDFHGSAFWFHNNESLNACSNTDKQAGFCDSNASDKSRRESPYRRENQVGFTLGGPLFLPRFGEGVASLYRGKDKTFFFVDYQHWSDRSTDTRTLSGAPTAVGRAVLQANAGHLQHVRELLRFVPAATPNGLRPATVFMTDRPSFDVELGDLTATADFKFDSDQWSFRIDHLINKNNLIYGRYRRSHEVISGAGQITPPEHGTVDDRNAHAAALVWSSFISSSLINELRVAWKRLDFVRDGENPLVKTIPAIQITELGLTGAAESPMRTAFGPATNLPVIRANDMYQVSDAISILKGNHSYKLGVDYRRSDDMTFVGVVGRGSLLYSNLSNFVNDFAQNGSKLLPIRGGESTGFYRWNEFYVYAQDQWRVKPNLTVTYGIRYEYPGDTFGFLRALNQRILTANNDNPALRFNRIPGADTDNWMPRVGFNWSPRTARSGLIGLVTGGDRLVFRGGYARAYDVQFTNININILQAFPFVASHNTSGNNAYQRTLAATVPTIGNVTLITRAAVADDFRAPVADQFSLDIQREFSSDFVLRVGYIRNRGTALLQPVDGNPRLPCPFGSGPGMCNTTRIDRNYGFDLPGNTGPLRLTDPTTGPVNMRSNAASSTYDALQISLEKRLSKGVSFGLHYTWSSFIDTASDIQAASTGDFATAQDPFDRDSNRARSSYDRPHSFVGNIVYELPFFQKQKGIAGVLLRGWQVNSFFSFQSGAPMTPLVGSDPAGANALSASAIRTNVFTNLDVSNMSVAELYAIDRRLRAEALAQAQQIYNNLIFGSGRCISSAWLPGPPLPVTLFAAPRGRIVCSGGVRSLDVVFNGILEGQRVGNAGRNILRSDSFKNVDLGIIKNTQVTENLRAQLWVDFFNAFNWRNFGIPSTQINDPGFLNQWLTDGGNRRIRVGARLVF